MRKDDFTDEKDVSGSDIDGEKSILGSWRGAFSGSFTKVILRLTLALLVVTSIAVFVTGLMKYDELERRREELEGRVEEIEYEIDYLEYLIDRPIDYDYIVRVAREKLGLHLPDEVVYYNDVND